MSTDVTVRFDGFDPPTGSVVPGGAGAEPVAFAGRLGLFRALDGSIERARRSAAAASQVGRELDAAAQPELGQHVGDVGRDGRP